MTEGNWVCGEDPGFPQHGGHMRYSALQSGLENLRFTSRLREHVGSCDSAAAQAFNLDTCILAV